MIRLASLLALILPLVGCQKETLVEKANRDGIFLSGNGAEPKALDPHLVTGVPESKIITALFEGLVADHPSDDAAAPPGAAESWTHNEELTEWTFKLRPDGRWSDGAPVTARDFVFAYRRMLQPPPTPADRAPPAEPGKSNFLAVTRKKQFPSSNVYLSTSIAARFKEYEP